MMQTPPVVCTARLVSTVRYVASLPPTGLISKMAVAAATAAEVAQRQQRPWQRAVGRVGVAKAFSSLSSKTTATAVSMKNADAGLRRTSAAAAAAADKKASSSSLPNKGNSPTFAVEGKIAPTPAPAPASVPTVEVRSDESGEGDGENMKLKGGSAPPTRATCAAAAAAAAAPASEEDEHSTIAAAAAAGYVRPQADASMWDVMGPPEGRRDPAAPPAGAAGAAAAHVYPNHYVSPAAAPPRHHFHFQTTHGVTFTTANGRVPYRLF